MSFDTFIYFYTEVSVDVIQHSETAHTGGNSNDGHGDSTPGPLYVYFDADANAETGFLPHLNGETKKPYVEVMVGIHNIFQFFNVDYVRRLNYNELSTSPKWGLRYSLSLTF